MPKLKIEAGTGAGSEFVLTSDTVRIGRRSTSSIVIIDEKASRDHCEVFKKDTVYWVRDLNSRNGTLLNNDKVIESPLRHGDAIRIGATIIAFFEDGKKEVKIDVDSMLGSSQSAELVNIIDITEKDDISEDIIEDISSIKLRGYTIIDLINHEKYSDVYKARQISMDRIVTLKLLKDEYTSDELARSAFLEEAQITGKINHPNILQIHDFGEIDGKFYFSREYVDGNMLDVLVPERGCLPASDAFDIVTQINKALEVVHQNDMIIGEIKPSNIIIGRDGQAKVISLHTVQPETEMFNRFAAPEMLSGEDVDYSTDIYSLGAVFYYMLSGVEPFQDANDAQSILEMIEAGIQIPSILDYNHEAPREIMPIIERMMARGQTYRFVNSNELSETLIAFKSGRFNAMGGVPSTQSLIAPHDPTAPKQRPMRAAPPAPAPMPSGRRSAAAPGNFDAQVTIANAAIRSAPEENFDFEFVDEEPAKPDFDGGEENGAEDEDDGGADTSRAGRRGRNVRGKGDGKKGSKKGGKVKGPKKKSDDEESAGLSSGAKISILIVGILVFGGIAIGILYGVGILGKKKETKTTDIATDDPAAHLRELLAANKNDEVKKYLESLSEDDLKKVNEDFGEKKTDPATKKLVTIVKELDSETINTALASMLEKDKNPNDELLASGKGITQELKYVKITINKVISAEVDKKQSIKLFVTIENTTRQPIRLDVKKFWSGSKMRYGEEDGSQDPRVFDPLLDGMPKEDNIIEPKKSVDDIIIFTYPDEAKESESLRFALFVKLAQKDGADFTKLIEDEKPFNVTITPAGVKTE